MLVPLTVWSKTRDGCGSVAKPLWKHCVEAFGRAAYFHSPPIFQYSMAGPLRPPGPAVTASFARSSISCEVYGLKFWAIRTSSSS